MRVVMLAAVAASLAGCIRSGLVDCGDGRLCPAGTACVTVAATAEQRCLATTSVEACAGRDAFAACDPGAGEPGACYDADVGRVCLPSGCGNGLLDPDEVCDDANAVVGDGCSMSCRSDESCGNGIVDPLRLVTTTPFANEQCDDGNLLGHDGCSSSCAFESAHWEQLVTGMPDARLHPAMAYDSARDRVVLFGGGVQGTLLVGRNDTWEWDGRGWLRVPTPIAPPARYGHVMAYDAVRRRVVLFGGASSGGSFFADTWEWDGTTWSQRTTGVAPRARAFAAAAYDPVRERVVLFGGANADGGDVADTWEWDGTAWSQRMGQSPTGRRAHGMTYDPVRGVIVTAGGINAASAAVTDTWEYDGTQWRLVGSGGPAELRGPFAFDGTGVLAFGGLTGGGSTANTWRWNGQAWSQLAVASAPPARHSAGLVADVARRRVIVLGGRNEVATCGACGSTRNDAWQWDGTGWSQIIVETPAPRAFHATAYDSLRGRLVVFGGTSQFNGVQPIAETWELAGGHWTRAAVTQPPARPNAAMAYDANRRETILFGGRDTSGTLGDTWVWDGSSWTARTPAASPPPRHSHAMVFDPVRSKVVLHGGTGPFPRGDTWEWDGVTWTQLAVPPIGLDARYGQGMAFDPVHGRVVLFSGEVPGMTYGGTWTWNGTTWTPLVHVQEPPPRAAYGIAWNGARSRMTLFGGAAQVFSMFDDTWELGSGTWNQQFTGTVPGLRQGHSLSPLPDGTGVLAFGGMTATALVSELWRLRWQDQGRYELCTAAVDEDGDGLAGCADPECWAVCTPLCSPGATMCAASWPRCGDATCNPSLESCRNCPQDCTCAPVCGDNYCDPGETAAGCPGDCR